MWNAAFVHLNSVTQQFGTKMDLKTLKQNIERPISIESTSESSEGTLV